MLDGICLKPEELITQKVLHSVCSEKVKTISNLTMANTSFAQQMYLFLSNKSECRIMTLGIYKKSLSCTLSIHQIIVKLQLSGVITDTNRACDDSYKQNSIIIISNSGNQESNVAQMMFCMTFRGLKFHSSTKN